MREPRSGSFKTPWMGDYFLRSLLGVSRVERGAIGQRFKREAAGAFVMTKVCTHGRDKNLAMWMLVEESLRRLQTDRLDLWQIHEVVYENSRPDLCSEWRGGRPAYRQAAG